MLKRYEPLAAAFKAEQILENEPMSRHTTFRVGGPADIAVLPGSPEEAVRAMEICRENGIPYVVLGNGSNVIVRDGGIRGAVILIGEAMSRVRIEGNRITAEAGISLAKLAAAALNEGLTGLEFASGIPGTLGGGCAMNAGAYGGQLSDALEWADVYMDGRIRRLTNAEMEMGYRSTRPLREGGIVLRACFALKPGDKERISETMRDLNARRRDKQPLNFPSAGSTFKRPEGHFAGALIQEAGLKGRTVGGAQVSEKHAGFIINIGGASAADILELIRQVRDEVLRASGIHLETEVRVLGE